MTVWRVMCYLNVPKPESESGASDRTILGREYFIKARFKQDAEKEAAAQFFEDQVKGRISTDAKEISITEVVDK